MRAGICTVLLMCWALVTPVWADGLRIAVASGFLPVARDLARDFELRYDVRVSLSSGASGALHAQIVAGAPFDLFVAADPRYTDDLVQRGRALSSTACARGVLVLWTPQPLGDPRRDLAQMRSVAIANPDLAPYGRAAQQSLQALGLWGRVDVVQGQNAGQALSLAVTGNASGGLVAGALVPPFGAVWPVPEDLYDPVDHGLALLTDTPDAALFQAHILGPDGQDILRSAGYDVD